MGNKTVTMRDLIKPEGVLPKLEATSKQQVLRELSEQAAKQLGLDAVSIFDVLWEREKLGTTGVGNGIAIPHGRVAGVTEVRGFFAHLSSPIAFDAVDDQPVDLVFMLLAPVDAGADHLHALASASRLLRNPALCQSLRETTDGQKLYKLLSTTNVAEAA